MKLITQKNYWICQYMLTILYVVFYDYISRVYMYPVWGYMGAEYLEMSFDRYILYIVICSFPIVFFRGLRNVASGFSILVYLFGIVPCTHAVFTSQSIPTQTFWDYFAVFPLCGALFFITDSIYLIKKPFVRRVRKIKLSSVEMFTLILTLMLVAVYYKEMRFVNFFSESEEMYELRASNSAIQVLGFIRYIPAWLRNALYPFLMIVYLVKKDLFKVCLIFIGYILLYMVIPQKITFILPFVIVIGYMIIKYNSKAFKFGFYPAVSVIIMAISILLIKNIDMSPAIFGLTAIFVMRTVCIEGFLSYTYLNFFENHPYTLFSHVNFVNFITQSYPYADSVGRTVAGGTQNANAIFLLMDGITGGGVIGVIVVAVLFVLVKAILNSIGLKYNRYLAILTFLPIISALLNVSLFTAILTGGILILYILFMYVDVPALK